MKRGIIVGHGRASITAAIAHIETAGGGRIIVAAGEIEFGSPKEEPLSKFPKHDQLRQLRETQNRQREERNHASQKRAKGKGPKVMRTPGTRRR